MFQRSSIKVGALVVALMVGGKLPAAPTVPALPKDVTSFLEVREGCDHWRGESGEGDKDRQDDIDWSLCQSCAGTDARLAALKKKYRSNVNVMHALAPLEARIEPSDPQTMKRFCATTRKPEWAK